MLKKAQYSSYIVTSLCIVKISNLLCRHSFQGKTEHDQEFYPSERLSIDQPIHQQIYCFQQTSNATNPPGVIVAPFRLVHDRVKYLLQDHLAVGISNSKQNAA